jgi:predicted nucleic acid-binding protein
MMSPTAAGPQLVTPAYHPASTIDCLVAQLALEQDLSLLQGDHDYEAIRAVRPLELLT